MPRASVQDRTEILRRDRVYVIAEAGVNHNGQRDTAFELVEAAAQAGADAVKFQTFLSAKLASDSIGKSAYQRRTTDANESQRNMLSKLELPLEWHVDLQNYAHSKGIEFISTAFDEDSLDFLNSIDIPFFKVPSGELTNAPLIWKFARTEKPIVLSTGMATLGEVEQALAVISHALVADKEPGSMEEVLKCWSRIDAGEKLCNHVTLLHCTSQYPAPLEEVNLIAMDTLRDAFRLEVGYSDHTAGILIPLAAVSRGARIIEKHFTLDRTMPGPDHAASLEPHELSKMISDIRSIELALGDGRKYPQESEWDTRRASRQQIVAAKAVTKGSIFQRQDLTTSRSGRGIAPSELWGMVGKISQASYRPGEVIE